MGNTLYLPRSVTTRGVALPNSAESEIHRENRQLQEELELVAGKLAYYTKELQKIDPYLSVVMAKPNATVLGLRPGYYHVVRQRPGSPAWIKVIDHEDGSWRDLDSSVFQLVQEADLWNDRTQREIRRNQERAEAARKRDNQRRGQDRAAEFDDRWKHATNVQISVPRDIS